MRIHAKIRVTNADRPLRSLDMIKGKETVLSFLGVFLRAFRSVMSGIITGPYFTNYFHLDDFQLGSVVAILEIGALSMF